MKYKDLENANNFIYINTDVLTGLFPDDSRENITKRLYYLVNTNKVIRLKRDFYILTSQYNKYKNYPEYLETIACLLKFPAYLSMEYVLRKYEILSEATYGFTLVTTKPKSIIVNDMGKFKFNQIDQKLFRGYEEKSFLDYKYYEATKAKALFDWLYYRVYLIKSNNVVEDLRLSMDTFTSKDYLELKSYLDYSGKSKKRHKLIIENIIKNAPNN